jgi:hypothetical protein
MLIDEANQSTVARVIEAYTAALAVEKTTGSRTTRTRNDLLQSLNSADFLAVSVALKRLGLVGGSK